MTYNQTSFDGGISRSNRMRTDAGDYPLLVNGRVRNKQIETILAPVQDTQLPGGNYQAITSIGAILVVVVSGRVYWRDTTANTNWRNIVGIQLNTSLPVDFCLIPASTLNYKRFGPLDNVTFTNNRAATSPSALFLTDDVNQPVIVFPVAGALIGEVTQDYSQWQETPDGLLRQYVPKGRFPIWAGKKLYIAMKDPQTGLRNIIGQSVTGRPLDFVMAIDNTTGDKAGDAFFTSHSCGLNEITAMAPTTFNDGSFIVCTATSTTGVTPLSNGPTFFGEYYLFDTPLFNVGALNQHSFVDVGGDTGLITQTGIRSFNATQQTKFESNNSPLSAQIFTLLAPNQTYGATADFDDYAFFALSTIYGNGVLIYDKTLAASSAPTNPNPTSKGKFISLDMYSGIGAIMQFTRTTATTGPKLWFITADNRLFQFGAASNREICRFYIGDWNTGSGKVCQSFSRALFVFGDVLENTVAQVTHYVDSRVVAKSGYPMAGAVESPGDVIPIPYPIVIEPATGIVDYTPASATYGYAIGCLIEWNTEAALTFASIETATNDQKPSQLSQRYLNSGLLPAGAQRFAFAGDFDSAGPVPTLLTKLPSDIIVIGLGDFFYGANHTTDYAAYANTLAVLKSQGRLITVAGNHDLDLDGGLVYYNYFGGKRYYSLRVGNVEFFVYNTGWDTANVGTTNHPWEPDGFVAGSVQAAWLQGALQSSTARFKFVILHEPPYTSSVSYSPGYTLLRLPFHAWGATAVFSGHAHCYERHIIDSINYYCAGTGGHQSVAVGAPTDGLQAGLGSTPGYLLLTTDEFNATTEFVHNETSFDRFTFGR